MNMVCFYDGPSVYEPDVNVRAYIYHHDNTKTGIVAGILIVPVGYVNYFDLRRKGKDISVCGDCSLRAPKSGGNGKCYVGNGSRIGLSLKYAMEEGSQLPVRKDKVKWWMLLNNVKMVRSAIYGDIAALPEESWTLIDDARKAAGAEVLGYTHGHVRRGYAALEYLKETHVISTETVGETLIAHALGWRTFRAGEVEEKPIPGVEFWCPASAERGKKLNCGQCRACGSDGNSRDIRSGFIRKHDTANQRKAKKLAAAA